MFRKEVMTPSARGVYGSIYLTRSLSTWLLVTIAVILVTCFLGYLLLGSYTKRATAVGYITPADGVVRIFPPIAGVISEKFVEEGKTVLKDEILFIISDERNQIYRGERLKVGEAYAISVKQRKENLLRAREIAKATAAQNEVSLKNKIRITNEELRQREAQINLQVRRVESAFQLVQRYKTLLEARAVSAAELQERNNFYEALQAELLNMQRQKLEQNRALIGSEDELRQVPNMLERALFEIDKELDLLAQETVELTVRNRYAITAPMDGVISSVTGQLGQSTNGLPVASLLPAGSALKANLYLPSKAVGFIKIGQNVRIRYQAYPYQKFGQYEGVVDEISHNPIQIGEIPTALPILTQEGVYKVSVKLASQHITAYGKNIMLRPGMIIDADIEQDRRRLIEWIMEPLFGISKYI